MSPSSVPELFAVTSSFPMDSAIRGTTDRLGVWKIQDAASYDGQTSASRDAASSGTMLTRYGIS